MSYIFDDPNKFCTNKKIIFLKVVKDITSMYIGKYSHELPIGTITWIEAGYIYDKDETIYHIEDNRYSENFSKEYFEVTTTPEGYNHLVPEEYKSNFIKQPKKN